MYGFQCLFTKLIILLANSCDVTCKCHHDTTVQLAAAAFLSINAGKLHLQVDSIRLLES